MRIKNVEQFIAHYVEVSGGPWATSTSYVRYSSDMWAVRIGESEEMLYGDDAAQLEENFQAYEKGNSYED